MPPLYDFRCMSGHTFEAVVDRTTLDLPCQNCDSLAQREFALPGVTGIVTVPMRERRLPITRFLEAQHSLVHETEKAHVEVPDLFAVAKATAAEVQAKAPELLG